MGRRAKRLTTANRKNCIWQQSPTIFWRLADAEEFFFSFFHDGRASYYYINPFVYVWAFVAMYIFKYGHRVLFSFFFFSSRKGSFTLLRAAFASWVNGIPRAALTSSSVRGAFWCIYGRWVQAQLFSLRYIYNLLFSVRFFFFSPLRNIPVTGIVNFFFFK